MKELYTISTGQVLLKSNNPEKLVKVIDPNPTDNWLIRVRKPNGDTTLMHKATLELLYRPAKSGHQAQLFTKPKTNYDRLKEKHLISQS